MTCDELKEQLKVLCNHGHSDDTVVVLTNDKSIGPHACSEIVSAHAGFDWDNGKILLRPADRLVHDEKSRDVPKKKILWHDVLHCPNCERRITKKARYCENCGQRLSEEIKVIGKQGEK